MVDQSLIGRPGLVRAWNRATGREDLRVFHWRFDKASRAEGAVFFMTLTLQCKDGHYRSKRLGVSWRKPRIRLKHVAILY